MKKTKIAAALTLGVISGTASATDYFFQTGRSAGYGSAGTTYAHWSAAASYNPALMGRASGAKSTDDFFLVLPSISGRLTLNESIDDISDLADDFEDQTDELDAFDNIDLLEGDINQLNRSAALTSEIIDSIESLDGLGGTGAFSINMATGISFEKFAIGGHIASSFTAGGSLLIHQDDKLLMSRFEDLSDILINDVRPKYDELVDYENQLTDAQAQLEAIQNTPNVTPQQIQEAQALVAAAQITLDNAEIAADDFKNTLLGVNSEYSDIFDVENQSTTFTTDDLSSQVRFASIGWFEVGATIGSKWELESGKTLSLGATVKSVHVEFFDYVASATSSDFDDIDGDDYRTQVDFASADLGVLLSLDPEEKWTIGATVKNIVGETIESNTYKLGDDVDPLTYEIEPQVRIGASYNNGWIRLVADADLTEASGPVTSSGKQFFQGSQYINVGAVINAWDIVELRAGYRHNMASADVESEGEEASGLVTLGAGLYLGPIQADLALQINPSDTGGEEFGFGFQTMITF